MLTIAMCMSVMTSCGLNPGSNSSATAVSASFATVILTPVENSDSAFLDEDSVAGVILDNKNLDALNRALRDAASIAQS